MRRILENARGWFYLYVGVQAFLFVYDFLFSVFLANADEGRTKTLLISAAVITLVAYLYNILYMVYRLVYLYRDTENRGRWTLLTMIYIVCELLVFTGVDLGVMGLVVSPAALVLWIVCLLHDYRLIAAEGR